MMPHLSPTAISLTFTASDFVAAITPSKNSLRVKACWKYLRVGNNRIRFQEDVALGFGPQLLHAFPDNAGYLVCVVISTFSDNDLVFHGKFSCSAKTRSDKPVEAKRKYRLV